MVYEASQQFNFKNTHWKQYSPKIKQFDPY